MKPLAITKSIMLSEMITYVESPSNLKILNSYVPLFIDCIAKEIPKPIKKLNSWPENIPATAVWALPSLANFVTDK